MAQTSVDHRDAIPAGGARPVRLDIFRTAIPMRGFEHAAAKRSLAEAVVTRLEFSDGCVSWGETLPRPYVTGETIESVVADMEAILWPAYCDNPAAPLPTRDAAGRCINAAACGLSLAVEMARPWTPRERIVGRVSGAIGSGDPSKTAWKLRRMRIYGLRDFKLKLGFGEEVDAENLRRIYGQIGGGISAGKYTLRVDVNGGWDAASTPDRVAALEPWGVCVVEQPVYCPADELLALARKCPLPLMADESILTPADAQVLAAEPTKVWWNLRISKNGGLDSTLNLARMAQAAGAPFVIGCMVGESGILSLAQRRLLEQCPAPRFIEGNYGRFLLSDDLVRPSPHFGYGGKLTPVGSRGVVARKLERYGKALKTLKA